MNGVREVATIKWNQALYLVLCFPVLRQQRRTHLVTDFTNELGPMNVFSRFQISGGIH